MAVHNVIKYGATLDGTTDDTAALLAAVAAAAETQGTVFVPSPQFPTGGLAISQRVTIPAEAAIVGVGNRMSDIILLDADSGITIEGRGGPCGGFRILANDVATAPLVIGNATERVFSSIDVRSSAGRGIAITDAQNNLFQSVNVHDSAQENVVLGSATNGNWFEKCEWSNAAAGRYNLLVEHLDGAKAAPDNNHIVGTIIERTTNGALGQVHLSAGSTHLLNSWVSAGEMVTPSHTRLVHVTSTGEQYLTNTHLQGRSQSSTVYHYGLSGSAGTVHLVGRCAFTNLHRAHYLSSTCRVRPDREVAYTGITQRFENEGGAGTEAGFVFARDNHPTNWIAAATNVATFGVSALGDTVNRFQVWGGGQLLWGPGNGAADILLSRGAANRLDLAAGDTFRVTDGTWNGGRLMLGNYHLWVDATGDLRIKSSAPASDTDGTVVGAQT